MPDRSTWVVKLGGSLAARPELERWLDRLLACGAGRVVVVPGGGPFADQVRRLQGVWSFDDRTAHLMALRAMDQYGLMLCGLSDGLQAVVTRAQLEAALAAGGVPLWLPAFMLSSEPELPASWDITSDSIAAWLARRLGAQQLVLVKYRSPAAQQPTLDDMESGGIVDKGFRSLVAGAGFDWSVLGRADYARFSAGG